MGTEFEAAADMAREELMKIVNADLAAPVWLVAWICANYPSVALEAARVYRERH